MNSSNLKYSVYCICILPNSYHKAVHSITKQSSYTRTGAVIFAILLCLFHSKLIYAVASNTINFWQNISYCYFARFPICIFEKLITSVCKYLPAKQGMIVWYAFTVESCLASVITHYMKITMAQIQNFKNRRKTTTS